MDMELFRNVRPRCLMGAAVAVACTAVALCLPAATNGVEKTMVVKRCLAKDAKGRQCKHMAEDGSSYCWRHCKAMRSLQKSADDTSKSANEAWQSTKQWSTNAWEQTKSGLQSAWDGTKDAADGARVGIVEMFGGKDAKAK